MTASPPCLYTWMDLVRHQCSRSTATPHTHHTCPCGASRDERRDDES